MIYSTLLESANKSGGTGIHWKTVSFSSVLIIIWRKETHDSIKKNTQTLLVASTEVDLEEKAEKTKCISSCLVNRMKCDITIKRQVTNSWKVWQR